MFGIRSPAFLLGRKQAYFQGAKLLDSFQGVSIGCPLVMIGSVHHLAPTTKIQAQPVPEIPTTIKTMGVKITTIAHLQGGPPTSYK